MPHRAAGGSTRVGQETERGNAGKSLYCGFHREGRAGQGGVRLRTGWFE